MLDNKKKAAIEMSLNLIIMLIIGMVVLGLVIGFVSNLIGQGSSAFSSELTKAEEQERTKVEATSGIFIVGPKTLKVPVGSQKKFFIKLRNDHSAPVAFSGGAITTDGSAHPDNTLIITKFTYNPIGVATTCTPKLVATPVSIDKQDQGMIDVSVSIERGACVAGDSFFITMEFAGDGTDNTVLGTKTETVTVEVEG